MEPWTEALVFVTKLMYSHDFICSNMKFEIHENRGQKNWVDVVLEQMLMIQLEMIDFWEFLMSALSCLLVMKHLLGVWLVISFGKAFAASPSHCPSFLQVGRGRLYIWFTCHYTYLSATLTVDRTRDVWRHLTSSTKKEMSWGIRTWVHSIRQGKRHCWWIEMNLSFLDESHRLVWTGLINRLLNTKVFFRKL